MSLVPEFELGLWNAWIFLIPLLITHIINARIKTGGPSVKILIVLFLILHILPVFLPLKLNTIWFYAGLVFYIVGMTISFLAIYGFATTPIDKPVTKVIFRYSRNPMYLGGFILLIGISLVSVSLIYFLLALIWMILTHVMEIPIEESECIKKYGTDYGVHEKNTKVDRNTQIGKVFEWIKTALPEPARASSSSHSSTVWAWNSYPTSQL